MLYCDEQRDTLRSERHQEAVVREMCAVGFLQMRDIFIFQSENIDVGNKQTIVEFSFS